MLGVLRRTSDVCVSTMSNPIPLKQNPGDATD